MRDFALIYLNGVRREIRGREALMMLAEWLRKEAGMTGTKIVCAEGDCGSCTVLRAFPAPGAKEGAVAPQLEFEAMNSCIATVAQMDGSHIVTVEGMACGGELSPAQSAMQKCHASQCGYCTPGFVMAMSGMLEKHDRADARTAANYLTGNLCRCTGYSTIVEAAVTVRATERHSVARRYSDPAAIRDALETTKRPMRIEHGGVKLFAPVKLRDAAAFAGLEPECKVLGAATDLGVPINKGKPMPRTLLSLHLVPELYEAKTARRGITVGARVTLAQLRRLSEKSAPEFARFLNLFASPQIKNVATLAGNIANASPIGDTLPFLLIAGGTIHVVGRPGGKGPLKKRSIAMTELYLGYKKLSLQPGEIITHVTFDCGSDHEVLRLYKVSQRKDLDISAISGAFALVLGGRRGKQTAPMVASARIAYGGVAATPIRVPQAEEALVGELTEQKVEEVARLIAGSIKPLSDVRGSAAYRRVTAANLFRRYGHEVLHG
ncbi:MAG: FAD binding domain-containing protein [Planctomycetes bacterium]|nr:FAD binding domain-containing protein [Planctomycetota bacterium]